MRAQRPTYHGYTPHRPMTTLVTPRRLAETYSYYPDPWAVIEEYYEVLDYHARTKAGRERIATRFEVPASRVRGWIDDENPSKPDPLRAVEVAEANGWVPLSEASDAFPAINRFVAELYARGVLAEETYQPVLIAPSDADVERAEELFGAVGLKTTVAHDGICHSREVRPTANGCVFGRVLACLGVSPGHDPSPELPTYLEGATEATRATFLDGLLDSRGIDWGWADRHALVFDHRDGAFLDALAAFVERFGPVERRTESLLLDPGTHDAIREVAR